VQAELSLKVFLTAVEVVLAVVMVKRMLLAVALGVGFRRLDKLRQCRVVRQWVGECGPCRRPHFREAWRALGVLVFSATPIQRSPQSFMPIRNYFALRPRDAAQRSRAFVSNKSACIPLSRILPSSI
jgi:hypothetical protein